jgi:Fic family protein
MHSLRSEFLDRIGLNMQQAAMLRGLGEYKGKQDLYERRSPETLDTLKDLAEVESTESSNRLEGIVVERKRIQAIVLKSTKPVNRSEQEVAGYRDALSLIHSSWRDLELDVELVRKLHRAMYGYLPEDGGSWKERDNLIIDRYADGSGRVRFRPVAAKDTNEAMKAFIDGYELAEREGRDPLVVIPLTVFDFLCIHPFRDGNGRMARLITLLLLYRSGYTVGRFISLERLFEQSKESYYDTLEASSAGWHDGRHDIMPWLTYFWGVLIKAYKEFEERVGKLTTGRGAKTEQIELAVGRRVGPFAISDIESECPGISRDMIRHVLRRLRDNGIIRSSGTGRGARWTKV